MIRQSLVSATFAVGLVFCFGCASADEASPDTAPDEPQQGADAVQGELGAAEQAITLPLEQPAGGSVQCVAACTRYSTTDLGGLCCACNGAIKAFARHPAIPNMYLCK
jgi:hypothetical protein